MFKKRLDLMFEFNEIKKVDDKNVSVPDSHEMEAYIEKENKKSIWEKTKDYLNFNLNLLKRLYSNLPVSYRLMPF